MSKPKVIEKAIRLPSDLVSPLDKFLEALGTVNSLYEKKLEKAEELCNEMLNYIKETDIELSKLRNENETLKSDIEHRISIPVDVMNKRKKK